MRTQDDIINDSHVLSRFNNASSRHGTCRRDKHVSSSEPRVFQRRLNTCWRKNYSKNCPNFSGSANLGIKIEASLALPLFSEFSFAPSPKTSNKTSTPQKPRGTKKTTRQSKHVARGCSLFQALSVHLVATAALFAWTCRWQSRLEKRFLMKETPIVPKNGGNVRVFLLEMKR